MTSPNGDFKGFERTALAHELAVLIGYGQMIEILTRTPRFLHVFGGPFQFALLGSLLIALMLLPVSSVTRGRWWALGFSWALAALCLLDGGWSLLSYLENAEGWSTLLASVGLLIAGAFLSDRLIRYSWVRRDVAMKMPSSA